MSSPASALPTLGEWRVGVPFFVLLLAIYGWAVTVGWTNGNLPGTEFR